jgi:anti-sigma factor RsiW
MTCSEVMEIMQRHLDQDISPSEESVMRSHILECPECAAMWSRLSQLNDELIQLPKVTPAFSLVDAILPRLEEIDRLASTFEGRVESTGAGMTVSGLQQEGLEASRGKATIAKSWFRRIPWATAGGVVAAGIVLGLFIVNQDVMDKRVAEDSAPQAASRASDNTVAADQLKVQAKSALPANEGTAGAAPGQVADRMMVFDQNGSVQVDEKKDSNLTKQFKAPGAVQQEPEQPVKSNPEQSGPEAGEGTFSAPMGITAVPESQPQAAPNQAAPAPAQSEQGPAPAANDNQKQEDHSNKVSEMPEEIAKPKMDDPSSQQIYGITSFVVDPMELASPNGVYLASIDPVEQHIVVTEAGKIIYTSPKSSLADSKLLLLEWESETKLIYQAAAGDKIIRYRIDLETKTEASIE